MVVNISALAPFVLVVMFYFIYNEKLDAIFIIGITLIIICAFLTSLSYAGITTNDSYISPLVPVMLVIVQTIFVALIGLSTRWIAVNSTMPVE